MAPSRHTTPSTTRFRISLSPWAARPTTACTRPTRTPRHGLRRPDERATYGRMDHDPQAPHVTQPCDAQEGLMSDAICGNFDVNTNTRSPLRGVTDAPYNARQTPDLTSALVAGADGSCRLPANDAVAFAPRKYSLPMAR